LARITVHPAVQGQGIGSRLLAEALADYANLGLQQVSLNTQTDNLTSHQLYRAFGFERYGLPIPVWERPV
jgi:ribosomal protein S18 acetylase RimI-like enzyme